MSGSIQSMRTRSGRRSASEGAGRAAVFRLANLETVALEAERDHLAYRAFVFDYQDLFCGHARPVVRVRARYYSAR